jgi:hypothetical protein
VDEIVEQIGKQYAGQNVFIFSPIVKDKKANTAILLKARLKPVFRACALTAKYIL